ncbi:MAG: hypothetical protein HYV09_35070 [Deltaproteobacteria bacterium]|nr:hypothetical protein [Deltaproteobacteria bacterium]
MRSSAAASSHAAAAEAATQAFHAEPGETAGTAIDAVIAGVLALAARHAGVMLGCGTILLGGTGEGSLVIDARARQPGLGAARPRGFTDAASIPDAARIAAPSLPAALTLAHAGRGNRTRTALLRTGVAAAQAVGKVTKTDEARVESLRAFGREGGGFLRAGPIRDALLEVSARSLGGTLTRDDLDAIRPEIAQARKIDVEARQWAVVPWARALGAHEELEPQTITGDVAIVAACDAFGAVAIASVLLPKLVKAVGETGLSVPLLARPVMRGVARDPAGAPLPMPAPIGVAHGRSFEGGKSELGGVDLALGLGGEGDLEALFDDVARRLSVAGAPIDDVIAAKRAGEETEPLGVAAGVLIDARGRGRALADPRRRS